jgi:small nuclear ribonucleoprotein (snRNP)-like protein
MARQLKHRSPCSLSLSRSTFSCRSIRRQNVQGFSTRAQKGEYIYSLLDQSSVAQKSPQFMDKKLFIHLQGGRKVSGTLRGYDIFLNLVIDDAIEETTPAQKHPIGTVVGLHLSSALVSI